jgi:hypothetical protein
MLTAALMNHIDSFHLGYNLYNTGTTGGFVATVVFNPMRGLGWISSLLFIGPPNTQLSYQSTFFHCGC